MSDDPKSMALTSSLEVLNTANHDFSLSMYSELGKKDGNIFFSPLSIHVIMFMASVGAASKTFDEMLSVLHLNKTTHSLEAYKDLLDNLINAENDHLKLATGMFVDKSYKVRQSYIESTSKYLKSSMDKLNFKESPEEQRTFINNWVLNRTNGKIADLFPAGTITGDTALVLANAVHFKSGWKHEFRDAEDEPFYLTPSNKVNVKMMNLRKDLSYYHDDELKYAALELPYEHHVYKMVILLPDAKDGLKNLENNLSKIKLPEILNKMTTYNVNVKLPRFKLEQSFDLKETLSTLGCPTMFTPQANFSNIYEASEMSLSVSKVLHKAYIDVNEKGTEAAAATGMAIRCRRSLKIRENKVFVVDHPFIFYILTKKGSNVFFGRMTKIESTEPNLLKEEL